MENTIGNYLKNSRYAYWRLATVVIFALMISCKKPAPKPICSYTIWIGTGMVKVGYGVNEYKIKNGYVEYFVEGKLFKSPECNVSIIETNQFGLFNVLQGSDYLRSKSYALPYLGLSVETQIEYGWVRLEGNN